MSVIWRNVWPFGVEKEQEEKFLAEEERSGRCLNEQGKNEDCTTPVYIELKLIKDNSGQITLCTDVLHDQDNTMVFKRLPHHQSNTSNSTAAIPVPSPTNNTAPTGREYAPANINNVTGERNHITNTPPAQDTLQGHKDTLSEDPCFSPLMAPTDHLIAINNANEIKSVNTFSHKSKLMKRPTCASQNRKYGSLPSLSTGLDSSSSGRLNKKMSRQRSRNTPKCSTSSGYSSFSRFESPCTNQSDPALITLQANQLTTNSEEQWSCQRLIDLKSNSCENSRNTDSKSMYLEDFGESGHYDRFDCRSDLKQLTCSNNSQHSCCFANLNIHDRGYNLQHSSHVSPSFLSREMCDASTSPLNRPEISWERLTSSKQTSISPVVQVATQDTSTQHINPLVANMIAVQPQKKGFPQSHYEHDAFIACNQNSNYDSHWAESLSDKLESPPYNFHTYWYERDHIPGRVIIQDKADQIQNSYKFICLLSPEFLNSPLCMKDLHMAYAEQIDNRSVFGNFVIVLKIASCQIPIWLKDIHCKDCVACAGEPDNYIVKIIAKAIRDDK